MKRVLIVLPLLLVGCPVEPGELWVLGGRLLRADGTPWQGAAIEVESIVPGSERELWPREPPAPWRIVTTGDDGWFYVDFRADDLETSLEVEGVPEGWPSRLKTNQEYRLKLPQPEAGRASARVWMRGGDNALPPLFPWDSHLQADESAEYLALSWKPLSPELLDSPLRYALIVRSQGSIVWLATAENGRAEVRAHLLEDYAAPEVEVIASASGDNRWYPLNGSSAHLRYDLLWATPPHPARSPAELPLSRGISCTDLTSTEGACPLTDGQLTEFVFPSPSSEIALQFGSPVTPSRLVIRGLKTNAIETLRLSLEGSTDGVHWMPLTPALVPIVLREVPHPDLGLFADIALATASPVSRIRIRGSDDSARLGLVPDPGLFRSMSELAVW